MVMTLYLVTSTVLFRLKGTERKQKSRGGGGGKSLWDRTAEYVLNDMRRSRSLWERLHPAAPDRITRCPWRRGKARRPPCITTGSPGEAGAVFASPRRSRSRCAAGRCLAGHVRPLPVFLPGSEGTATGARGARVPVGSLRARPAAGTRGGALPAAAT